MLVGKAIKKYNIPREKLVILTKCFAPLHDDPYFAGRVKPDEVQSKLYVNKRGHARVVCY
jgi:aryl-alcohol dehydrogenase-like predicted oxidoreductase